LASFGLVNRQSWEDLCYCSW